MKSFKRNLLIGYGVSLLLLIVSAIASYISINGLLESQKMVNHTNNIIIKLQSVMTSLVSAETGQRGYLLTGIDSFLEPYKGSAERTKLLINEAKTLTRDNPEQQVDADLLASTVDKRLFYLTALIEKKDSGLVVTDSMLLIGKLYMNGAEEIIIRMQDRERALLEERTASLNQFAGRTPLLIVIASALAFLVTIISFFRVLRDFNKREELQFALQQKDEEITKRLNLIQGITEQISAGNYDLKIDDEGQDTLGSISGYLNKMTGSLQYSFNSLSEREWVQSGVGQLNDLMIGEKDLQALTRNALEFITTYTKSEIGAFYLVTQDNTLSIYASTAADMDLIKKRIVFGEGLSGQAALSGKEVMVKDIPESNIVLEFSGGVIKPKSIIAIPIYYERVLKGVIELATIHEYSPVINEFLKNAVYSIGIAIHSARDHQRLQDLLHETQAQSEELQAQHSELENVNAELEAQAEKLQASEEELRVQQEELQQANQELEERSRLLEEKNELILERNLDIQRKAEELTTITKYKSEFLANMSHELRTPLNSVLLLSRLLSENHDNNLTEEQIEYANVIQTSGKGLLTLIDEILDLSKIESGKMELEYNDLHLSNFKEELRSLFAPMAKEKGIGFDIRMARNVPGTIETDRLRLEQILRNLISNALKFTRKGSVEMKIEKVDGDIHFAVKDTGIGIPKEKQQTIFEAFQQADGSTRRQFGGTGLGLSISRELARLLGGEIQLESEEGKGSQFTLVLPIDRTNKKARKEQSFEISLEKEIVPEPLEQENNFIADVIPASVPDDRNNIKPNDKVILVIEDDTAFAKSLVDYTRNKGYKAVVAVRGDEGIELAKKLKPHGILLDVQLPVKSGWEVMEELKNDKTTKPIPVHVMSSYEVKTRSLSKGAIDFISKPVAFEKLGEIFVKIEQALTKDPKKVLIVEENTKHAQALSYFLESYNVNSEIRNSVGDGIDALSREEVDCVILDMGVPAQRSYDVLEEVKKNPGMENLPIIVFTGKNLSHVEEMKIKQYANSIVVKTAHSYQRILDEVSLFLHLVEENEKNGKKTRYKKMGEVGEVLKGKTVLIADDDVRNIFSLTKSLESYGMNVISAIDGKDALNQLTENGNVDMVLMDMMMPEMDGYESTRRIREIPKFRNLPIIAVTAKAMTGDREKCIAAGASDYITKPVDVDQLISLLRVWLYE